MTNQEIVAKLWNLCNVLRDDGITYHQYVTELTYILFLKMAKETGTEDKIPEKYRWDRLAEKDGLALKKFYEDLLRELGEKGTGRIQEIYSGARSNIEQPANLKKIITNINDLDWYSAKEEGLGNLYEGLLEKNANEKKSGAGQYFTPRVLIDIMTELIAPQPGERCNDPACGTFGFMIAADAYVKAHTDDLFSLTSEQQAFQKNEAFTGAELVHETHRLALMNAMLHDIDGKIYLCDTLSNQGKQMNGFDVVLTNPPFGTKKGGERANRDDFTFQTSNKQLNFLPNYLVRYINSSMARGQLFAKAKSSSGIHNINSKELGSIRIDVPTIEEQTEILKIIEPLIKKELAVKNITSHMIENIAELKKSILTKAFRGELGTNVSLEKSSIELLKKTIEEG